MRGIVAAPTHDSAGYAGLAVRATLRSLCRPVPTGAEGVELVRMLAPESADDQIGRILSRKRLKTGTGLPFNAQRVTNVRSTCNIAGRTRT